jgi:hypothetical protein
MPDDRPNLLPPLNDIYDRLSDIEIERAETRKLLRLALDRHDRETGGSPYVRAESKAPRRKARGGRDV